MKRDSLKGSLPMLVVLTCGALLGTSGCGHPATRAECEEILDKVIDLELKDRKVSDEEITKRRESAREARGAELLGKCENRRITDRAMACIRGASSVDQITNQCLR